MGLSGLTEIGIQVTEDTCGLYFNGRHFCYRLDVNVKDLQFLLDLTILSQDHNLHSTGLQDYNKRENRHFIVIILLNSKRHLHHNVWFLF